MNRTKTSKNTQNYNQESQQNNFVSQYNSQQHANQDENPHHTHPLSKEDLERQKIAEENHEFVKANPQLVPINGETIYDSDHTEIQRQLSRTTGTKFCRIFINSHSSIWSAIYCHRIGYTTIYVLNFVDAFKPGGSYLNGRCSQEETLCRQTLLYPSLVHNDMYSFNSKFGSEGSDVMIYSPNVLVIRNDDYEMLPENDRFYVNFISSAAVDNREKVANSEILMERRIRKVISLAAFKVQQEGKNGKNALILGAFGCGVFKNDPNVVAAKFAKILNDEKMKDYFDCVIFPIFNDHNKVWQIFQGCLIK